MCVWRFLPLPLTLARRYGLLGSTGWGELESDSISRASAYLNVDTIVSGDVLSVSATPALAALWREVMGDLGLAEEHRFEFGNGPVGEIVDANVNKVMDGEIGTLGSGSDYTVFLDRLGIASLDFSFGKKGAMYVASPHLRCEQREMAVRITCVETRQRSERVSFASPHQNAPMKHADQTRRPT